jgi:hypothetical protein
MLGLATAAVIGGGLLLQNGLQSSFQSASQSVSGAEPGGGQGSDDGGGSQPDDGVTQFQDNFSGKGDLKKWRLVGSTWTKDDGALLAGYPRPKGEERAFAEGVRGADLTIKTKATLFQGDGYGLIFRATGDLETGYTFQFEPGYEGGQFTMRKWVNGYELWPPIASAKPSKGFDWDGVEHEIQLDAAGSSFTAKIDGKAVLQARDSSYSSGGVGLRVWGSTQAAFDSFAVRHLGK